MRNDKYNNFDSATLHHYLNYLKMLGENPNIDFSEIVEESDEIMEVDENPVKVIDFTLASRFFNYRNYCYSLLAKPFVILAGNSGTGKTKIATDLATWLGKLNADGEIFNKLVVPVGADWTDNTKILGFYNPIEKKYESSKILDFILLAEEHPDIPFFLILDEMNLSHVERYFSDFLSAMESKEPIILYAQNNNCNCNIPETIILPDNLFVTGTVNIDETTYMFSPKVLDRANVIEFKPTKESVLELLDKQIIPEPVIPINDGSAEAFQVLFSKIRSADITSYPDINFSEVKQVLGSFYDELEKSGFEFAYRTVKEITHYVMASFKLSGEEGFYLEKTLDEQITQKILPKLHGNKKQIGSLLTELEKLCVKKDTKKIRKDTDIEVSGTGFHTLELSFNKIGEMQTKLNNAQYASFI